MIHTRTKIIALISLGLCLGSLLLYGGMFYVVNGQKQNLYDARLKAAEAEMQARALSALEETVRRSTEDRAKLQGYILAEESIIDFLSLVEVTAREQGVKLDPRLEVAPIDDVFEELRFNMSIDGSFDGVMRMLRIIETLPGQGWVPSVSITRAGEEGATDDMWRAVISLVVTKYKKV
jgi:hypothetical protein